jgi:RNA polymerase sigma factor (sigma-70 family)
VCDRNPGSHLEPTIVSDYRNSVLRFGPDSGMIHPPSPNEDADDTESNSLNDSPAEPTPLRPDPDLDRRLVEFERLYRAEFGTVAGYFARRTRDPQLVADLTADTFVVAMRSYASFQPSRTNPRAWTLGVARRVYARHTETAARRKAGEPRRASIGRLLSPEETEELLLRIDLESSAAELLQRLGVLPEIDREAIELIDLDGLSPAEAARELGLPLATLHARLLLARARLRRSGGGA